MTINSAPETTPSKRRARALGLKMGELPSGEFNAITDVAGVRVGHTTLVSGDGSLVRGSGPVRTGVTVVLPCDEPWRTPLFAAPHRLNGNGELTGLEWVRESGTLTSFIGLTNTHSVGVVRDALVAHEALARGPEESFFSLPVVGETWDGILNDLNGFHVRPEHVEQAIASATSGPVAEGSVGSGTGMIAHGFKGGIGTSSRVVSETDGGYTVGVLVQANHGRRSRLTIDGVQLGDAIQLPDDHAAGTNLPEGSGSIIVIIATDAPLLPHQCARLAQRSTLGIARVGGAGENGSGDLALCFSTANLGAIPGGFSPDTPISAPVSALSNDHIDPLFYAVIEATEEAIVNAMLAADTMVGINGTTRYALPQDQLVQLLARK
ncbi:P1 family peptidase [Leucobacter insecticola]|uniref:P1 family peptidase n=1 Tax=Leucobacter insecticola TaxID=2714934 RepID=A0A6G8FIS2_9MICO|nr:P1 family peptidase [Leucobacter insecticola]QIM16264.1 P1 family peptidase [Leucobacter insecticola]